MDLKKVRKFIKKNKKACIFVAILGILLLVALFTG